MAQARDPRYGTMMEVLTRPNPDLRLTATSTSLSTSSWWQVVNGDNLSEWAEFSYETLMNGWGHILQDGTLVKGEIEEEITDTQRSISDEDKVDDIARGWTINSTRESLKRGARILRPDSQSEIVIAKHARKFQTTDKDWARPDMAIYWRDERKFCLAVGDNKTSKSWNFAKKLGKRKTDTFMRPINQITTYCMLAETRYGWIMSDKELVCCRISYVNPPNDPNEKIWKVEYKIVPWGAAGSGALTVNLAIWWLGMMGTSKSYRTIPPKNRMMPINFWWEDKNGDRTVGYTVMHSSFHRSLALSSVPDTWPLTFLIR